jgi:hypothetical protein
MIHLSARLAWHDVGWNGCVCKEPHLNTSCIVHEQIRDERNDEIAQKYANTHLSELSEKFGELSWLPPCCRDIAAYAEKGFRFKHEDPLNRKFLSPVTEEILPYSCLPAPYRWMLEANFRDICETESLKIRGSDNSKKDRGWVYEPDRQIALLNHFWDKVKEWENSSLIFYYVNHGNPIDDQAARLLVGVGRLAKVGAQHFFDGKDNEGNLYPIWTRTVSQDYPSQGFRLPYHEYIEQGKDPRDIACYIPKNAMLPFSYVGEHVSDDVAVGILELLIQSVQKILDHEIVQGPWNKHLNWLNECLSEVWHGRGPFPGIGSILEYLGFPHGTAFQRLELKDHVRKGENPWTFVRSILEGHIDPPAKYGTGFSRAQKKWAKLLKITGRTELLAQLARFELSLDQVRRICDPESRAQSGIETDDTTLLENPYIISEMDLGDAKSMPISLEVIDHGMLPEGDAALFSSRDEVLEPDDVRRVRAISVDILKEAANSGDTLLTLTDLLSRIRFRFPERRTCKPDRDIFLADSEFHEERLWLDLEDTPQTAALQHLHNLEKIIANAISQRIKRHNPEPNPPINWQQVLMDPKKGYGPPNTERQKTALEEKSNALTTLYRERVSILTGSAGTGKTSMLRIFLDQLQKAEGRHGLYLLAPTGKARVRLSTSTGHNAYTIHQFVLKHGWFLPDIFVLKENHGNQADAPTIIIDESSMIPVDLMGTLFKALKLNLVKRLILVGDPNQLPPIGPGRPFIDIITWLKEKHPSSIATLFTTMRITDEDEEPLGKSRALAFADGYCSGNVNPADDELLAEIAQGKNYGDLEVYFWRSHDELLKLIKDQMYCLLKINESDYKSFNQSLGITDKPWSQPNWKKAEHWQILSPQRIQPFGTDELNRQIQMSYRGGLINNAQNRWSKAPRPFGEHQIVYTDKVIQVVNSRRNAWPKDANALNYVANGEIGIVTVAKKSSYGEYLQVGFSTQNGVTYRYYRSSADDSLELAYALTVHKAQGSDFEIVFLIVPKEAQTLSRELIYTGLTRFRKRLVLLVEGDTATLKNLRLPDYSDIHLRNTNLFGLNLRPDQSTPDIPFPESLIHRTKRGVLVRSKSEVIVADVLDDLVGSHEEIDWKYEHPLFAPDDPYDYRLPDFTIGFAGDVYYWEHLGMLTIPSYREGWRRKHDWYVEHMGIPVVGDGALKEDEIEPGTSPLVITSRDKADGGIDQQHIEMLAKKYILLE